MRIAVGIEYDGSAFRGWQLQDGVRTVQGCVERALSKVANEAVRVICAGRTDAGVHGLGQVIHFEVGARRAMRSWVLGGNSNLPQDICLLWAVEVEAGFHARFAARSRRYRYVILNRWVRPGLQRGRVTWVHAPLDVDAMQAGARHLIGEHDFSSYRALACQAKSPVRRVYSLDITRNGDYVYIDVHANAFLHHMVRNIAGVLIAVGKGERSTDWPREVLALRDRTRGGVTAPPDGLYFVHVEYDERFALPQQLSLPYF
ncbi:tRNA pseudouridine(38-40) synthase TruA [Acidihalobacter ferrooxydans]|uniref:tRNA pseudouridine synthase A n=1 Tax=Acidihalobacter ferrooxydans TaxID=1765967 RepID=A0A1P8UHQ2_9GAMM|nr:tRNA pseudouridine(38-40) synthase TruA [Acidihalobacter ferrooxydans]APZ43347.1 tRNA pseudouridine(38-40) synthase TruA [Acidihalobacter ferrooxydans]